MAVSDSDIVSRLQALSIAHPEIIDHAAVKGGAEWKAELDKVGHGQVALTKTVSPPFPTRRQAGCLPMRLCLYILTVPTLLGAR